MSVEQKPQQVSLTVYVSEEQLRALPADPDDMGGAGYLPIRRSPAGKFQLALSPSQEQLERALQMIEALDSYIDATPRGERKVRKGDFAQIAAAALAAAPERIVGAAK